MNRLLTKTEVADLLNVSPRTVDRLRQTHNLGEIHVGQQIRFRPDVIEAGIEAGGFNKKRQR